MQKVPATIRTTEGRRTRHLPTDTTRSAPERDRLAATQSRHSQPPLSEHGLLALQRLVGNQAIVRLLAGEHGSVPSPVLQRYFEEKDSNSDNWRRSESGKSAVMDGGGGSQTLFASPSLIDSANKQLRAVGQDGSFLRLTASKDTALPPDLGLLGLSGSIRKVTPRMVSLGKDPANAKLKELEKIRQRDDGGEAATISLWADCGRASRVVMGVGSPAGGGDWNAHYPQAHVKIGGAAVKSYPSADPASYTNIYAAALPKFMADDANKRYLKKGIHFGDSGIITPVDLVHGKRMYWELGAKGRRVFDQQAEINKAANPAIGGSYTMATEREMPGFKEKAARTWVFHWAGVVMKDGANNITLENYAVGAAQSDDPVKQARYSKKAYDTANRDWLFQMYGTKKKGQSFHAEHLGSGTHGTRASTFAVKAQDRRT